jgi:hypothetical protein
MAFLAPNAKLTKNPSQVEDGWDLLLAVITSIKEVLRCYYS